MQERMILSSDFKNQDQIKGFEAYDYEYGAVTEKATAETVFRLINGVVSAVEAETALHCGVPSHEHAPLTWEANRTLELVKQYDEFINAPDFELDIFSVHKFEMENFWARMEREKDAHARKGKKNYVRTSNKAVTDGKSTIYQVDNGKVVFGYLVNNMTYDGQNSFFLASVKSGRYARALFKTTGRYPAEKTAIGDGETRWGRIVAYLAANGGDITNAYSILEEQDSMFFYAELKKHNGVDKQIRRQLKAVRRAAGGMTFDLYIESLEERREQIEAVLPLFEELRDAEAESEENGNTEAVNKLSAAIYAVVDSEADAELELEAIEAKLTSFSEEHNSDKAVSLIGDYDNWDYYKDGGY